MSNEVEFKHKYKDLTIKDKEKTITATKSKNTTLLKEDIKEQVKLMLEVYEARGLKLENLVVTGSKEFEDETIKQILVKIENMSLQDRYEFLAKLKYSEQEVQAINLYYEKLNKAKSIDNKPEESKDEDIWDTSDENIEEASSSLLKLIEDNEIKKMIDIN